MAETRVVFELTGKERRHDVPFLLGLHTALDANCKHLDCAIAPKREFRAIPGISRNLHLAASNALHEMRRDRNCERCLYIAPRAMVVPIEEEELRIKSAVLAVRNRKRVTGAFVLKIKTRETPELLLNYLDKEIVRAVSDVVDPETSPEERAEAHLLFAAVVQGYQLAIEMLSIKAGTRRLDS